MRTSTKIFVFIILISFSCNSMILEGSEKDSFERYVKEVEQTPLDLFQDLDKTKFDLENPKKLALQVEKYVRTLLPHAGNQIQDYISDPTICSKTCITRVVAQNKFQVISENFNLDNIIKFCFISYCFKGGCCNEYAYLSYATLLTLGVKTPFHFCISEKVSHAFVCIGDIKDLEKKIYVVDPWTIKRDVILLSKSRMSDNTEFLHSSNLKKPEQNYKDIIRSFAINNSETEGIKLNQDDLKKMEKHWESGLKFSRNQVNYFLKNKKCEDDNINNILTNRPTERFRTNIFHSIRGFCSKKLTKHQPTRA